MPLRRLVLSIVLLVGALAHAHADPAGGTVVSGQAAIMRGMGTTTITQLSDRAIIHWDRFSIGAAEQVRFAQPSRLAIALNRVTGVDPSVILGSLKSNGRIFLVNPAGIVFGSGAVVEVGGLLATTLDIRDSDFMQGRLRLKGAATAGSIVNKGRIQAADGGYIVLVAPLVTNEGTLVANLGQVALLGGTRAEVAIDGRGLISVALPHDPVDGDLIRMAVNQDGVAEAGTVINRGTIQAPSIELSGRHVMLGGIIDAGADGRVLIDPVDLSIVDGPTAGPDTVGTDTLASIRAGLVTLQADRDLYVNADVTMQPGVGLTLLATTGDIVFASPTTTIATQGLVTMRAGGAAVLGNVSGAAIDIGAGGPIVLQATLTASAVSLKSDSAIVDLGQTSVRASTLAVMSGDEVSLDTAVQGQIKVAARADVSLSNSGAAALDASSGGSIYVSNEGPLLVRATAVGNVGVIAQGGLVVDQVSAGQTLALVTTEGPILAAAPTSSVRAGGDVSLLSADVVGTTETALQVTLQGGGLLQLSAEGERGGVSVNVQGTVPRYEVLGTAPGRVLISGVETARDAQATATANLDEQVDIFDEPPVDADGTMTTPDLTADVAPSDLHAEFDALAASGDVLGAIRVSADIPRLLMESRPHGWEAEALSVIEYQLQRSRAIGYRVGEILALDNRADLRDVTGDARGARADRITAAGTLERWVGDVGAANFVASPLAARTAHLYGSLAAAEAREGNAGAAAETMQRQVLVQDMAVIAPDAAPGGRAGAALERAVQKQKEAGRLEQELVEQRAAAHPQAETVKRLQGRLAASRDDFLKAVAEVRALAPQLERLLSIQPVRLADIQASLPREAALVQLLPTDDRLYAFVVTRDGLRVHSTPLQKDELDDAIREARQDLVSEGRRTATGELSEDLRDALLKLHVLLVGPVEEELEGHDIVAFVPSGRLLYVPFGALARLHEGRLQYLAQRKQVVVLAKAGDVLGLGQGEVRVAPRLTAFGNPDGTLPGSQQEALEVAALFPPPQAWVKEEATTGRLERAARTSSMVHLATHGVLNNRKPASSYMVMARQGQLTIPEIAGIPLASVRLVTLSACQTALGQAVPGTEISSLAEAFSLAGTRTVIATLWSVSDRATRELMVDFYRGLREGRSVGVAMQQAQRRMIEAGGRFSHPFFWAPFVLFGDWR